MFGKEVVEKGSYVGHGCLVIVRSLERRVVLRKVGYVA